MSSFDLSLPMPRRPLQLHIWACLMLESGMSNIAKRFDAMLDALTASKLDWQYSTNLP